MAGVSKSRHNFYCRDREWPRLEVFRSQHSFLCRNKVWPKLMGLVLQHSILCRDRMAQGRESYVATKYFYVPTEFGLGQGTLCHDRVFISR